MKSSCTNDDTFGPVVHGCRDDFDLTIKFEQVILTIVPAAVFIVAALPRFSSSPHTPDFGFINWF
ncbi:hypothetical protein COL26b_005681 [Colletotrichum chrysophilum]|uniref:uncharacterized protein n=1 Tax=Colletotrichum chrysophilum TaxID=1836956 RepID=UPI002300FB31|nr:uncharacterized protein COL26b_005681 [Colletotrichum chrysophilum]KAJ0343111.1 hypothetical protein COL922a_000439 [Colletotrichum nupharicola]KAJ0376082.1 hypothetical protein COL26b_005681 [Colletotrichum chrysophilum]